ncbi:MAG: family 43 glycosylhydrolase [Bacteroidales bacterium]|nr:family 43 glycosylhydrolase [Bacteroidales bacterium]
MKTIYCTVSGLLILTSGLFAQNPIVPEGVYIADPSAHVWADGKIYVYGSRDESPEYYCSKSYRVLSSDDLKGWKVSGESFASAGPGDQVPYSDAYLYAPDAQYYKGKYYLYYCLSSAINTEGVAVSDSPLGPFKNGTPIDVGRFNQIDPGVFIDDDGNAYYVWGQFNAKMARMKHNMMEIDTATIVENVITEEDHFFHEGCFMIKRNGLYYLVYADVSRGGAPTCLGYSVSSKPMGPYTYKGVIIDNRFCDPNIWNNHGSIAEFMDRWYVFYHRATNGSVAMRKACLEPITFREDGTIPEVVMTSQGAGDPLDAFSDTDAARACLLYGNVRIKTLRNGNEVLGEIWTRDKVAFRYLDFGNGADSLSLRLKPGNKSFRINISAGSVWTGSLGSIEVPAQASDEWITVTMAVKPVKGIHILWFTFSDPSAKSNYMIPSEFGNSQFQSLCTIASFRFSGTDTK